MKAGVDIGTSSVCVLTVDGAEEKHKTAANDCIFDYSGCRREQDARAIIDKTARLLSDSVTGELDSVGVTGQMHGIVYVDKLGEPVGPLYTWQDERAGAIYRDGLTYCEYLAKTSGCPVSSGYGLATHFYNAVNGLVPREAVTFCTIHDLLVMKLTGRRTPLVHPSDAASFGFFDLEKLDFDADALRDCGIDPAFLPEVSRGEEVAGEMRGAKVYTAIGDNQASYLGSVGKDGGVLINVGTGSQVSAACSYKKDVPEGIELRPFVDGGCLAVGAALCGGRAYADLERFFRAVLKDIGGVDAGSVYAAMDALTSRPSDCPPLDVSTRFCGTRSDPNERGYIRGLGEDNFTPAALCDGVLNGIAAELFDLYERIETAFPGLPDRFVCSGNGVRKNEALRQRLQKRFGREIPLTQHTEEAAYGAYLLTKYKTL
ncbi:MAG: hypothetical protein IJM45_02925 [Clostridia bacterium]|nr:hypothetical protein [Clostridia bacterium]